MKLKFLKTISLLSLSIAVTAFADEQSAPLAKQKLGDVVYSVSSANRMLHLELPFSVTLDLVEVPNVPAYMKYYLSVSGDWDPSLSRPEVLEIKNRYPGYKISEQSQSVAIRSCKITLGDGTDIPCETPPGTAAYFSATKIMSAATGDRLKADLIAHRYPKIVANVGTLEPWIEGVTEVRIRPAVDCKMLIGSDGGLTLGSVMGGLVKLVPKLTNGSTKLTERVMNAVLDTCLDKTQVRLSGSAMDLSDLMEAQLRMNEGLQASSVLRLEELVWKPTQSAALLSVRASVK